MEQKEPFKSLRSERLEQREREHKLRLRRLIPLLIFAAIAVLIAKQEIPAVDSWISRIVNEEAWQAVEACRQMALDTMTQPGYTRIEKRGKAKRTEDGFYVDRLMIAELLNSGEEIRHSFSCNVNRAGVVLAISHTDGMADATEGGSVKGRLQDGKIPDP
jgi:hypothetical protein